MSQKIKIKIKKDVYKTYLVCFVQRKQTIKKLCHSVEAIKMCICIYYNIKRRQMLYNTPLGQIQQVKGKEFE